MSVENRPFPWLFSAKVDLLTFGGSATLALGMLAVGAWLGVLHSDSPEWTWVIGVLLIDVAHVYSTGFRVYFDRQEACRRPWLYFGTPCLAFFASWIVYSEDAATFWRCLAYLATFHFIRQQYGWVALYRAKDDDSSRFGRWLDTAAIYVATLYPLAYWHAHLPRRFWWFVPGDYVELPTMIAVVLEPIYWAILGLYATRSLWRGLRLRRWNPGKDLVVFTTAMCWYVGIITFNSDFAFTTTNVLIHGIPYLVLIYWYSQRHPANQSTSAKVIGARLLGVVWLLAYVEELMWDRGLWHERSWLFGSQWDVGTWEPVLVALLTVPQITHYVLDGFVWKRRTNKQFRHAIGEQ
jgi:hypothetical protein